MPTNFCPTCGADLQYKEAEICPKCGVRIQKPLNPFGEKFAGFWIRFGAWLIDIIIILILEVCIGFVIGIYVSLIISSISENYFESLPWKITFFIIHFVICWIYFAYLESSSKQATFGKQIFSLIIVDMNENRISFGTATVRFLSKILSGIIFGLGYLMIGFTERKQGLHDIIVKTYVVYKDRI